MVGRGREPIRYIDEWMDGSMDRLIHSFIVSGPGVFYGMIRASTCSYSTTFLTERTQERIHDRTQFDNDVEFGALHILQTVCCVT